jgi:hypothetical protein
MVQAACDFALHQELLSARWFAGPLRPDELHSDVAVQRLVVGAKHLAQAAAGVEAEVREPAGERDRNMLVLAASELHGGTVVIARLIPLCRGDEYVTDHIEIGIEPPLVFGLINDQSEAPSMVDIDLEQFPKESLLLSSVELADDIIGENGTEICLAVLLEDRLQSAAEPLDGTLDIGHDGRRQNGHGVDLGQCCTGTTADSVARGLLFWFFRHFSGTVDEA